MKFRRLISPRYNYNLHTIHPNIFKSKDLNFSSLFFSLENAKRGIWLKRSRETNTYGAKINSLFYIFIRLLLSAKDGHGTGRDSAASFVQCRSSQGLIMSGQLREILSQSRSARRFPSKFRPIESRNVGIFCPAAFLSKRLLSRSRLSRGFKSRSRSSSWNFRPWTGKHCFLSV